MFIERKVYVMHEENIDPWDVAAQRRNAARIAQAADAEVAAAQERITRERERTEAEALAQSMQAAIDAAVPELEAFLRRRGAAAKALLAAVGEQAHVMFGSERGGGSYHSVFFYRDGLTQEVGHMSGYSSTATRTWPATAHDAVEYFAYYGYGRNDPERVRTIVAWFEERMDAYARRG
jgi:hypothetical protein